jgi:SAM-dependent methyltransferase
MNADRPHADHRDVVERAVLDEDTFLGLTLSGRRDQDSIPWIRIRLRPVMIRGHREIQFSYFDGRRDITKNFTGDEVRKELREVLSLRFSQAHVRSTSGDMHVRVTRKGRVLITRGNAPGDRQTPVLSHNHIKRQPLSADIPDPFLKTIGVMNKQGQVRASMWRKFRQINEFLRIVERTLPLGTSTTETLGVVDCGCGSAHLTFAAYHYLNHALAVPTRVMGVDISRELIEKCRRLRDLLDWDGLEFRVSDIASFAPAVPPDMVVSLHACDTATDEAIAHGILWDSRVILAAPCCQHELHGQLRASLFRPLVRHGILRERLADLLTDTFRALVLRIMGYRTSVVEFISPEYTSKNLMIRAERGLKRGDTCHVQEYRNLTDFWGVSPAIEDMLGEEFRQFVAP